MGATTQAGSDCVFHSSPGIRRNWDRIFSQRPMEQLEIDWGQPPEGKFEVVNVMFDHDNLAIYDGAFIFMGPRFERYELVRRTGRYSYVIKRKP